MSIQPYRIINSTSTLTLDYEIYYVDASAGSFTITLPSISIDGLSFIIKRIDTISSNIVTIIGNGSDTIDNFASVALNVNGTLQIIGNFSTNNWTTTRGSNNNIYGPNNEIQVKFNSTSLPIQPYLLITITDYTIAQHFVYRGSDFYGKKPTKLTIAFSLNSGINNTSFTVKIIDVTNANQIAIIPATATGNSDNIMTASTTSFTNIPTGESIFEIQGKLNVNGIHIRLHSLYLQVA